MVVFSSANIWFITEIRRNKLAIPNSYIIKIVSQNSKNHIMRRLYAVIGTILSEFILSLCHQ